MLIEREPPNPYQVMFLVAAILGGGTLAALGDRLGSSLAQALPDWVTIVLALGMVAGGVISAVGMAIPRVVGMLIERVGVLETSVLFLSYAGFTLDYIGARGFITIIFFMAFAAAGGWRAWQLTRSIRRRRADIHEAATRLADPGTP